MYRSSLTVNIPHKRGTFVTVCEPTLTGRYRPQSMVYIRVHSWAVHSVVSTNIQWHVTTIIAWYRRVSLTWKFSVLCLSHWPLATTDLHIVSIILPSPECQIVVITACSLFRLAFPLYNMPLSIFRVFSCLNHFFSVMSNISLSDVQFSSVAQSCPTLCDPMDCSTPGFPIHHQLPEFTQTHVHWIGDAIQLSHPLLSPPPPTFDLSQHQGLFQWVSSLNQVARVLEFQLQHQSFQWIFRTDFL